jgi:organic radical activating enzyme
VTKTYPINETFLSLQGEGARAGTLNVFVRFAGCNLQCSRDGEAGFDCDTEFVSHRKLDAIEIAAEVARLWPASGKQRPQIILTGGEPLLHVDLELLTKLAQFCGTVCIETNGTQPLPAGVDPESLWISCSPKTAEHTLRVGAVNELRYVRHAGQGIPMPSLSAPLRYLSPAWDADGYRTQRNLQHCMDLIRANPEWRLSVQQHKLWRVR